MTISFRLTLWFAAVLVLSLMAMGALSYYELILEPREHSERHEHHHRRENADGPVEEISEALTSCAIPALILGLGGGWWLMRRALAPVRALTRAAEQVTEHNFGERIARSGNGDELDRLTQVFNDMIGRLQLSFSRIREFTLHASHELKTPLTVMHGEVETALQDPHLPPEDRARLESQLDEFQRLGRIVDGLTLLTKAGAGQIPLSRETVALNDLVQEAFADAQSLARPRAIDVRLEACEPIQVIGDRHRLRQLLLNLTDNAIKHNRQGGHVGMNLRRSGGMAEFTITNTGPGITPETLPRIYDPFFRGDASRGAEGEGSGLGLSIVRWIVHAHGGDIEVTSESEATTARVRLPV
ncbi:MAG TPA: ATP-binding protein [Verrucomicrobiae bacterium]|nr:ATP-binding protein [Verrucomicrobiae bacterium]